MELLELCLTRNDFEFEGHFYLQIKGTAMGKRFAPAYANIYMAQWEQSMFADCAKLSLCYLQYLDDIWEVWQHGHMDFQDFLVKLNTHHASIKVKAVLDDREVAFLDTAVWGLIPRENWM